MTSQEYQHIKFLSSDLLVDAKISSLPVDIKAIAMLYGLDGFLDYSRSRYVNTLALSRRILSIYGYSTESSHIKHLAVRILSPMIVLIELNINTIDDIRRLTELPYLPARFRFDCYRRIIKHNSFNLTGMDRKILTQFQSWIAATKLLDLMP